jgi:hypothetical protein
MRTQVHRQRGEIRQLQRAGIITASAEALLERMLTNIDRMCAERDKLKKEQGRAHAYLERVAYSARVPSPLLQPRNLSDGKRL